MYPDFKLGGKQLNVEKVNLRYLAQYNQIRLVHVSEKFPWTCRGRGEREREKGENRLNEWFVQKMRVHLIMPSPSSEPSDDV